MRYVILFLLFTVSLFAAKGDVVHSFKTGKIQFLSEQTPDGKIVGLLKPLKSNTTIESIKINGTKGTISFQMLVKDENPNCGSWTDVQPVTIQLDPKPVTEITLTGKQAKSVENITILTPAK